MKKPNLFIFDSILETSMRYPNYTNIPFFVFDAETNILNDGPDKVGKNKASPFHPDNGIEWWGCTKANIPSSLNLMKYPPTTWSSDECHMDKNALNFLKVLKSGAKVMVGHNIKFDLLHMMQYPLVHKVIMNWLRDGGVIWDTMIAEYLLTGQEAQFISLDNLSKQNGGTVKDDRLKKEYWEKGIDTALIPKEIIIPYLEGDLKNTAINYMSQLDKIESLRGKQHYNFYALIAVQMEALLATTMIEFNGIYFDVPKAADAAANLAILQENKENWLKERMAKWFQYHNTTGMLTLKAADVNPASMTQLSAMIVGGAFKYVRKMPVLDEHGNKIQYKSGAKKGQFKERNEDFIIHVNGMMRGHNHGLTKTEKGYKLDETALKKLMKHHRVLSVKVIKDFIEGLLVYRSMSKELSVSYMGLLELTWPTDSCIHGNMNHCSTNTGRLSSSAPNQQNFSAKETKE